ncbi:hypothetical protein CBL_07281 [Carabus blaptoides fortunei]
MAGSDGLLVAVFLAHRPCMRSDRVPSSRRTNYIITGCILVVNLLVWFSAPARDRPPQSLTRQLTNNTLVKSLVPPRQRLVYTRRYRQMNQEYVREQPQTDILELSVALLCLPGAESSHHNRSNGGSGRNRKACAGSLARHTLPLVCCT